MRNFISLLEKKETDLHPCIFDGLDQSFWVLCCLDVECELVHPSILHWGNEILRVAHHQMGVEESISVRLSAGLEGFSGPVGGDIRLNKFFLRLTIVGGLGGGGCPQVRPQRKSLLCMLAQALDYRCPPAQVGYKMAIHHVNVQNISSSIQHTF